MRLEEPSSWKEQAAEEGAKAGGDLRADCIFGDGISEDCGRADDDRKRITRH